MSAERFIDAHVLIHHLDVFYARKHAAALEADGRRLVSEELQHGQRIESSMIDNPFRT